MKTKFQDEETVPIPKILRFNKNKRKLIIRYLNKDIMTLYLSLKEILSLIKSSYYADNNRKWLYEFVVPFTDYKKEIQN